jgi:hypothetical protein
MGDKELNALVSLKNIAPYRAEEWHLPNWAKAKLRLSRKERKKKALEHHGAVKKGVRKPVKEGEGKRKHGEKRVKSGVNGEAVVKSGGKDRKAEKEGQVGEGDGKKKKRKRERQEKAEGEQEREEEKEIKTGEGKAAGDGEEKKKRKRRKKKGGAVSLGLSESRLQSYGQLTVPGKKVH